MAAARLQLVSFMLARYSATDIDRRTLGITGDSNATPTW